MHQGDAGGGLSDFLEREVIPRLSVQDVYRDVDFRTRRGRYWRAPCPLHKGSDPNFNVNVETLGWVCFSHCGSGSVVSYLNGGETPHGSRFVDIVRELAQRAGVSMPERAASTDERAAAERRHRRSELLEGYCALAAQVLTTPAGAAAVGYLASRGFPDEPADLARLGLGVVPSVLAVEALRASGNELRDAGLADHRWTGRLVIPWRDLTGRVATIAVRSIGPADPGPRYLYLAGLPLPPFFGLDHVRRQKSAHSLIVVEGPLDALAIRVAGIDTVVALGGSQLGTRHMDLLRELVVDGVTLALDNDDSGAATTARFIEEAGRSYPGLRIQVIPPDAFGTAKDPSELAARGGSEAIYEAISRRLPANVHRARLVLRDLSPEASTGSRRDALAAVRSVVESITGPERAVDIEDIVRLATEHLGYSDQVVREAIFSPPISRNPPSAAAFRSSTAPPPPPPLPAFDPGGLFHPLLWDVCRGQVPRGAAPIEEGLMWRIVDEIDPRLAALLSLHYGRYGPYMSFVELAPLITSPGNAAISRQRVSQLHRKAIAALGLTRRFEALFGLRPYAAPRSAKRRRPWPLPTSFDQRSPTPPSVRPARVGLAPMPPDAAAIQEPTPRRVRSSPRVDLPTWRSLTASCLHVTPASVASDELLWAIADAHPRTMADLARIPAVDQSFFEAYGEELLIVLRDGVEVPEWEGLGDDSASADDGDVPPF